MPTTAYWNPNQAAIAQVETYTFTAPSGVGNTYTATINGKSTTYASVSGDTATTVATALFNLLNQSPPLYPELGEIAFANPSAGVVTATAGVAGTPFANITIAGVAGQGLVMSTGNGLVNGIATAHTTANKSPSDVNDPQNWLRFTPPAAGVKQIPQNGDIVVVQNSAVPMLWNLDALASVQFASFTRYQSMTGTIGLPVRNTFGYMEWRAKYFSFIGPAGSVPAGGLQLVVGQGIGSGPASESYNVGSQPTTLTVLAGKVVNFVGVHTQNTFTLLGSGTLNIATDLGTVANLFSSTVDGTGTLNIGNGVTWTVNAVLTVLGGTVYLGAAPTTLILSNGSTGNIVTDLLTWTNVTIQGASTLNMLAGGTITTLTMTTGSTLDKSNDARALTVTNSTIDGDTCFVLDSLNAIAWTNATSVKQRVAAGPFQFTGTRTVKVT